MSASTRRATRSSVSRSRRLRRDLEHYYLTDGRADPIRITIPKGRYVPAFEVWGQRPAPEALQPWPISWGFPWRRLTEWRAQLWRD